MRAMWELCKGKMVCEGDELLDDPNAMAGELDENGQPRMKKSHGGCGTRQPSIKREGLKLVAVFKQAKDVNIHTCISVV